MFFKYVVINNTINFCNADTMLNHECNYTDGEKILTPSEAFKRKKEGLFFTYPKQSPTYHYYVYKDSNREWSVKPGKDLNQMSSFSKITRINKHSCSIVVLADLDTGYPEKELLLLLGQLINGICTTYNISSKRVLPRRYFEKDTTSPGLLFNVRRFVREYITKK